MRARQDGEVVAEKAKKSKKVVHKLAKRKAERVMDPSMKSQFDTGRLYALLSSRPGQSGRADGYILEVQCSP